MTAILAWFTLRLRGARCYACQRPLALHGPWRTRRCARTPLAVRLVDEASGERRRTAG
jgi:hypothetical protein